MLIDVFRECVTYDIGMKLFFYHIVCHIVRWCHSSFNFSDFQSILVNGLYETSKARGTRKNVHF